MDDHFNPVLLVLKILFWCTIGLVVWLIVKVVEKLSAENKTS